MGETQERVSNAFRDLVSLICFGVMNGCWIVSVEDLGSKETCVWMSYIDSLWDSP